MNDDALAHASRALARGDALLALQLGSTSPTPPAQLVRGIAYAQLGDFDLARTSLEDAGRSDDPRVRARASAALVELLLETGDDPSAAAVAAADAALALERLDDLRNATMMRLVQARAEVLRGRLGEAAHIVDAALATASPDLRAVALLARAEIAIREVRPTRARASLAEATRVLGEAPHALLHRALGALEEELARPLARLRVRGEEQPADLFAIEDAARGDRLLVDDCRRLLVAGRATIPLARRPVLFGLLLELARAWPDDVARDELARRAFGVTRPNASHRARLRVEIGRLRKILEGLAEPVATAEGYALRSERDVVVLAPTDDAARMAILLGDGAAWSARSLAEHAGVSLRTAQRTLSALVERGAAHAVGSGRYVREGPRVASRMLLLGLLPRT